MNIYNMSYTSTQRFVKLTGYMLLEYEYTSAPSPEIHYVNTGVPSVGFEKIVNGYFDNKLQILNRTEDLGVTNNVRDLSVVQVEKNRFVTLDNDYLQPYLNTDPNLTSINDLPVVFPSNIGVYYDTVKFHIVSGYSFSDLDGVILKVDYQERTGKKATVLQLFVEANNVSLPVLNPNPIYLGGALYDHYIEVKIPAYANMVYEFETLNGSPSQASTLAAKISSDGQGFIRNSPVEFSLYEVSQTVLKNGYQNYIAQLKSNLAIVPLDNYGNLSAVVQENTKYHYIEYYPTWNGNYIEDFINAEGYIGNAYYVVNEIEIKEQVGLSFMTTYNTTSIQTQDFNAPYIFRPILVNPLATSFIINYTLRLVNKKDQTEIIRRASFASYDVSRYGREINKITLTSGAYAQKVYNKIIQAPNLLKSTNSPSNLATPIEKKIPVFYKDTSISVTQQTIVVDKDGNVTSESGGGSNLSILGQGQARIVIDPFDNFYKFTLYTINSGSTPETLDLGTSLSYYLVFMDSKGQTVKVENIKNKTTISNPIAGQIAFKIVDTNSKKILGFDNRDFYIISKTPDSVETKVYSGIWQNQAEYKTYLDNKVSVSTSTSISSATATTTIPANSVTSVNTTIVTPTANVASQLVNNAPSSVNKEAIEKFVEPYSMGSSSVVSFTPANVLEGKGDVYNMDPAERNRLDVRKTEGFKPVVTSIDIASLASSISGLESQGMSIDAITKYYFTPGSPGNTLFKDLTKNNFLKGALQVHPKLSSGAFDPKYIAYCNALNLPVTEFPEDIENDKKNTKFNR